MLWAGKQASEFTAWLPTPRIAGAGADTQTYQPGVAGFCDGAVFRDAILLRAYFLWTLVACHLKDDRTRSTSTSAA